MKTKRKFINKFGLNKEDFDSFEDYLKEYKRLYNALEETKARLRARGQTEESKAASRKRCKKYRQTDKGKVSKKRYNQTDKGKVSSRVSSAKRRATKLQRTVGWSELEKITDFYKLCPPGYHVDHIIPLQGKLVSGLHVLANLQYLPAAENCSKGNRYNVDHILPLSKGGLHIQSNLQVITEKANKLKGDFA